MLTPAEQEKAVKEFIARHARPYDPATDDYERPPFAADTKEGKNDPIYNAHSYHTKVPPRSIIPYILHYTEPGDLILDPFCGSGMTGVAAQMCAEPPADLLEKSPELKDRVGPRACILNDLSPAACHIAHNYNAPVDVEALQREFDRVKAVIEDEFAWLYGTEHYEPAIKLYALTNSEVSARLKNPASDVPPSTLIEQDRPWELIDRSEVERRLGYPVAQLPRRDDWGDTDLAAIDRWIAIPATIQYTIWSDVYKCEGMVTIEEPTGKTNRKTGAPAVRKLRRARGCGAEIILWNIAVDHATGTVHEVFTCPSCGQCWKKIQISRIATRPVAVNCDCYGIRQPCKSASSAHTLVRLRYERPISASELARLHSIEQEPIPHWFPRDPLDTTGPQYCRNALSARKVRTQADFYTHRNLRALARLWHEFSAVSQPRLATGLLFVWTSIYNRCSRRTKWHRSRLGQAALSGQLYIPSLQVENNILSLVTAKLNQIVKGLSSLAARGECVIVSCGSAGQLTSLPPNSVDYVFCDPPFGSNIYYSEVNLLWESWLGRATDQSQEAVVHRKNDRGTKTLGDYARLMHDAFATIHRVLKPGRWATVEFNNSDGTVFEAIKDGIRSAGFEIANMLLLDKKQKTFKQVKGAEGVEDVVDKDVLFNLHKPAVAQAIRNGGEQDLEHQIAEAVRQHLRSLPDRIKADPATYNNDHRTAATINSMLMNILIPKGVGVERLNLPFIERVCGRYFRKVGQHWYLRGEAIGNGNDADTLVEEEVVIHNEVTAIAWLRQQVKTRPALIGELKPLWMRATGLLPADVSQDLVLVNLLTENFWRDSDTNRWREPTDEERERMNDDRSIRVLHDAERFVDGQLKRRTTDDERCEWMDVLFQACRACEDNETQAVPALRGFEPGEGYRLISRLFQSILREKVPKDAYGRAEKQARVASQRISKQMDAETAAVEARQKKKEGPTLFDGVENA